MFAIFSFVVIHPDDEGPNWLEKTDRRPGNQVMSSDRQVPVFGGVDIHMLKKALPGNPIWKCRQGLEGQSWYPTARQALRFYRDLKKYAKTHRVSAKSRLASALPQPITITSDDRSVFDDLLTYLERVLPEMGVLKQPKHLWVRVETEVAAH